MTYDVLVLGGGAAGCALAARLSENPDRSVCLVEAGPDYGHLSAGRWPADILDPRWLALDRTSGSARTRTTARSARARILGGCSAHNACVLLEGAPSDYDWGGDWSYDAFAPYLRRAYETLRGHVLADEELTPWHRGLPRRGRRRARSSIRSTSSTACAGTPASPTSIPPAGART